MNKDYKRLTARNEKGEWTIKRSEELNLLERNLSADDFTLVLFDQIAQRLCDLEDKIENGTLVPKYSIVDCGGTYCVCTVDTDNLPVIDEYETKAEAEAKLLQLKGERE